MATRGKWQRLMFLTWSISFLCQLRPEKRDAAHGVKAKALLLSNDRYYAWQNEKHIRTFWSKNLKGKHLLKTSKHVSEGGQCKNGSYRNWAQTEFSSGQDAEEGSNEPPGSVQAGWLIRFSWGTHHSSVSFFRVSTKHYILLPSLLFPTITNHLLPHVTHSFWRISYICTQSHKKKIDFILMSEDIKELPIKTSLISSGQGAST